MATISYTDGCGMQILVGFIGKLVPPVLEPLSPINTCMGKPSDSTHWLNMRELQRILRLPQQRETCSIFLKLMPTTSSMVVIRNVFSVIGRFWTTTAIWALR